MKTRSPLLLLFLLLPVLASASEEFVAELANGDEIPLTHYPAQGDVRLLWLTSEFGLSARQRPTAEALAARGVDTWVPDLHSAWFIPAGRYSLNQVDPAAVSELIRQATRDGQRVFLLANGRTTGLALRALRHYQEQHANSAQIGGLISVGPRLFLRTPQGGESETFLPVASASNVPVFVLQPRDAGGFWRADKVAEVLASGGSPVYLQVLEGARDGFNLRSDVTPAEETLTRALPDTLLTAMRVLGFEQGLPATAAPLPGADLAPEAASGSTLLKPYPADRETPTLRLADTQGEIHELSAYRGKVVVLNFWATWCPPCVEELPSLQRLYAARRGQGLEILAVDVGEPSGQVVDFLAKIDTRVEFPVLLDSDGEQLRRWKVYAFPTTLLIDPEQRIRYAGFGAFAWDDPEILALVDRLLAGS